jgi:hypothetical protein
LSCQFSILLFIKAAFERGGIPELGDQADVSAMCFDPTSRNILTFTPDTGLGSRRRTAEPVSRFYPFTASMQAMTQSNKD